MNPRTFIQTNTRLLPVPLVPEVRLHLADESVPIWQKTEEELGEINVPPPYWAFAWAGGQALARYALDHAGIVAGRRVVDVGAGSGLAAIAAAMAGAATVVASDIDAFAIEAMALNAEANAVALTIVRDDLLTALPVCDVLLVGDLFYERALADRVLASIEQARDRRIDVLVGDPGRSYFPRERFEAVGEYHVPVTRELEDAEIKRTSVWKPAHR